MAGDAPAAPVTRYLGRLRRGLLFLLTLTRLGVRLFTEPFVSSSIDATAFWAVVHFSWRCSCLVVAAPTGARPTEVAVGEHTVGVVDFPTASSLPLFLAPVFVSPASSSHLQMTVPRL